MHISKKIYLLVISCLIIAFSLVIVEKYSQNIKDDNQPQITVADSSLNNNDQVVNNPDIIIKDTDTKKPVITKPVAVVPKPQKNPNLITAESYLVGNVETGEIYLDFNSEKIYPIASLSKLFTALIDVHAMDQTQKIIITQSMLNAFGDAGHLVKDEKFTPAELLYPLLLESSNDAAEALAQSFGYEKFIKSMNDFATEMGISSTSFKDASGLNSANVSTSKDLFALSRYYYGNEKDLLAITRTKDIEFATTTDHGYHHFFSINPFVFYPPFVGGKTGRTDEALESMVTILNMDVASTTYPIAIIVLRSQYGERGADTEKILELFNKKILKIKK